MRANMRKAILGLFLVISITFLISPSIALGYGGATKAKQDAWFATAAGRHIGNGQCVAVANDYCIALWNRYDILGNNGAWGFYNNSNPLYFSKILYTGSNVPVHGDIVIVYPDPKWSPTSGHVAVVDSATSTSMTVLQQNGSTPNLSCARQTLSYYYVHGWLRPKLDATGPVPGATKVSAKSVFANGENILIKWKAIANAATYNLAVYKGGVRVLHGVGYTGTSKYIGSLPAGNYTAYMRAYNSANLAGPYSNTISFSVQPLPGATTVSAKSIFISGENILINWTPVTYATTYNLAVYKDGVRVAHGVGYTGTSKYIGSLPEGNYTAYMRAYNLAGVAGPYSNTISFTVNVVPSRPVLSAPANGAIVAKNSPLSFKWTFTAPANGPATGYAIELLSRAPAPGEANNRDASIYRIGASILPSGSSTTYPGSTAGLSGTYYWRIIAIKNGQLYGVFSDARQFKVQ